MKKKNSLKLDGTGYYLSLSDKEDWKFGSKDFAICGFCYRNKKGKLIIEFCKGCKHWTECKRFKSKKRK